jgi:hypothetical protein
VFKATARETVRYCKDTKDDVQIGMQKNSVKFVKLFLVMTIFFQITKRALLPEYDWRYGLTSLQEDFIKIVFVIC